MDRDITISNKPGEKLHVIVEAGRVKIKLMCRDLVSQLNLLTHLQPRLERDIVREGQHRQHLSQLKELEHDDPHCRSRHASELLSSTSYHSASSAGLSPMADQRPELALSPKSLPKIDCADATTTMHEATGRGTWL